MFWGGGSGQFRGSQQLSHAASVFVDVRGGVVGGAGDGVERFVLSLQLRLGLQGQVLQLHQHLSREAENTQRCKYRALRVLLMVGARRIEER